MLRVQSLGSGSSGNATLIDDGKTVVLIDCGVSHAAIVGGLASLGRTVEEIAAVLITHEHADHVRSLDRLVRAGVPVMCTIGTAVAAGLTSASYQQIALQELREVRTVTITSIPVCHDAAEPCGFLVQSESVAIAVVTDAGCASDELATHLSKADLIVLESNHDERMLRRGPYPAPLKRRVLSDAGHLSNFACAELLARVAANSTKRPAVWLAHLSAVNNRPALAVETAVRRLYADSRAWHIEALPRLRPSRIWRSDQEEPITPFVGQIGLPGFE
jgi:phosphoribosyl 1,2-cyclic phosphodiesterase